MEKTGIAFTDLSIDYSRLMGRKDEVADGIETVLNLFQSKWHQGL